MHINGSKSVSFTDVERLADQTRSSNKTFTSTSYLSLNLWRARRWVMHISSNKCLFLWPAVNSLKPPGRPEKISFCHLWKNYTCQDFIEFWHPVQLEPLDQSEVTGGAFRAPSMARLVLFMASGYPNLPNHSYFVGMRWFLTWTGNRLVPV